MRSPKNRRMWEHPSPEKILNILFELEKHHTDTQVNQEEDADGPHVSSGSVFSVVIFLPYLFVFS